MAKQLDYSISIASTENDAIHGIHVGVQMTITMKNYLETKGNDR